MELNRTSISHTPFLHSEFKAQIRTTFQPSEWAFQSSFIKKRHHLPSLVLPLPQCTAQVRAGGGARSGSKKETGTKNSLFKLWGVTFERSTSCLLKVQWEGEPRGHFPGWLCQTQARQTEHPCHPPASSSSPSPVCLLFIVRDALSYHKQRALTITKGFSVLRAVYYYSINQYSSHHMVKH